MPEPTEPRPPQRSGTGPAHWRPSLPLRDRADGRHRWGRARGRDPRALSDALHLLDGGPCAVCRERDEFAARWLKYFVIETHTEQDTRARVEAAAGFCPAHTRRLLADASASWLMPQVHDLALAGWTRLLDAPDARRTRCPCCVAGDDAAERASGTLLNALGHPPVMDAVRQGALCLPHLAVLAARMPRAYGPPLADAGSALLGDGRYGLALLAGADEDAPVRNVLLGRLDPLLAVEEEQQRRSVTGRWRTDTDLECCPLCLAEHRSVRRLSTWAAATAHGPPSGEESVLCARHLHDLAAVGGPNVAAVLAANRDQWDARFGRFRRLLGEGGRRRADAGPDLLSAPRCRACEEQRTAGLGQTALLAAQLQDPVRAEEYTHTHGICLRHALNWRGAREGPVHAVLAGRTALLRWEIDEVLRKQNWRTRHETVGAEREVVRRAPTLLDGRIYAGLPAPHDAVPVAGSDDAPKSQALDTRRTPWSST
ncbi:hypothetical protein ACFVFH_33445 [Streptomyces sp. NPDC057697]|uniref:hypothetical protein n=1 Tax=Streptomyces sp. NPDC057697 TaxID=3346219 RepID=UPI0036AFF624